MAHLMRGGAANRVPGAERLEETVRTSASMSSSTTSSSMYGLVTAGAARRPAGAAPSDPAEEAPKRAVASEPSWEDAIAASAHARTQTYIAVYGQRGISLPSHCEKSRQV